MVVDSGAVGLVAVADCRQQDAIWMALLDPPKTFEKVGNSKLDRPSLLL